MKPAETTSEEYWIMQAKPTPYWKFLLGGNYLKGYQLDFVEGGGSTIRVRVQSGKEYEFTIGKFKAEYTKGQYGLRSFTIQSTSEPKQKISFLETQLQMPEEWWDELERKLSAAETGLSKALNGIKDVLEGLDSSS